jgi:two-component system sensor histidine kinase VicK
LVKDISTHSLRELLEQSIDQQGRIFVDKNIEILGLDIIPIEYESEVDLVQLTQVFGNLFNNAASYSPAGSKIEVKAEPHDGKITVSIKDQGLGIPKPQQEKMFTKFFRGDNVSKTIPGSGLGLYVAKSIVENHGGKIWFESAENLGTTFFIEIPLKQS